MRDRHQCAAGLLGHRLQALVQKLYAAALARVDGVFFQNPDDAALFKDRGILPASVPACVVNGSGVDVAHFAVAPLPAHDNVMHFLLIGRLLGDKGAITDLRQFLILHHKNSV